MRDCESVLDMLEDEEDRQRWRVLWAEAMALVRAVGHVLRKVDGGDARLRPLIDAAWDNWKADRSKNSVFWEFIQKERNYILKEYRFGVLDSAVVGLGLVKTDGGQTSGHTAAPKTPVAPRENLFRPLEEGFGIGEDARDVYRDALQWWDAELASIEAALAASKP